MTVAQSPSRRGAPLVFLTAILLGWGAVRMAMPQLLADWTFLSPDRARVIAALAPAAGSAAASDPVFPALAIRTGAATQADRPVITGWESHDGLQTVGLSPLAMGLGQPAMVPAFVPAMPDWSGIPTGIAAGHQALAMAGLGYIDFAAVMAATVSTSAAPPQARAQITAPQPAAMAHARWSADGWLLWRPRGTGRSGTAASGLLPVYGASQAGAVLRYRLAPQNSARPEAYLRATSALAQRERALAAGLSARPVSALPVRLAAEARLQDDGGGQRVRPVAMAITELPPVRLPLGLTAEAYGAAGYAGGKGGGAFGDGQITAERQVAGIVHGGGGIWAGGQQNGGSRVDIGPRASLRLDLGGSSARLAVDWRQRVAGAAEPRSGAAITLAAGF